MKVYIDIQDKRWKKYSIDFMRACRVAGHIGGASRMAQVSIILTDDEHIHQLNRKYRHIDRPTNVLSFELGDPELLGDVYISFDTVMREVDGDPQKFIAHAMHMAVHGTLHLLGFDHIDDEDAIVMQSHESVAMQEMGLGDPYGEQQKTDQSMARRGWVRALGRGILYFVCGMVGALGFAPYSMWGLTILAIGLAYAMTRSSGGFWRGMWRAAPFGAGYALVMFGWMINAIFVVPDLREQFAIWTVPALMGIALAGAFIFALPFAIIQKNPGNHAQRPFLFAAAWTFVLWMREWILTGFPWNPVANIMINVMPVANSMSLWGAMGLTFILVGIIASVVEFISSRGRAWAPFLFFAFVLVGGAMWGAHQCRTINQTPNNIRIRIVQPARPQAQKMTRAAAMDNLKHLMTLAQTPGVFDLIVMPETSYPFALTADDWDDFGIGAALKVPVIIGSLYIDNHHVYNSLVVANRAGRIDQIYHKSHLVPFGEYAPLHGLLPSPGMLTSGRGPEIMHIATGNGDFIFAPAVCYEIIFSDSLVTDNVTPMAIVNITNDTWFGRTPGTYQHLDMVRRYAIESGLPVVRANYSGISAFVTSLGVVTKELGIGVSGVLDASVGGAHMTPYRRVGRDGWMIILLIVSIVGVVLGRQTNRRQ